MNTRPPKLHDGLEIAAQNAAALDAAPEANVVHRQIIAIQETDPPPLARFAEGVPDRLEEIVAKALAKDPNHRYQTAKDLLIDLRNLSRKLDVDAEIERTLPPEFRAGKTTMTTASGFAPATTANASSAQYIVSGIKAHKLAAAVT